MDVMSLLRTVPAAIAIVGLLTYFMRARAPVSDQELMIVWQRVRNTFCYSGRGINHAERVAHPLARAAGSRCRPLGRICEAVPPAPGCSKADGPGI
jgi:hypothetical protein